MSARDTTTGSDRVRVVFDQRIFVYQPHGGMSRYYAGLIAELPNFDVEPTILAPFYTTERLRDLPRGRVWGRQIRPERHRQRAAQILGELALSPLARLARADVVHETFYSYRRRAPRHCKIVTTVHDMIPELFPQFFSRDITPLTKRASVTRADHIVCDSENTRQDLLRLMPEAEDRTSVIYLAYDPIFDQQSSSLRPWSAPYMVYVGGRGGWKNFDGLLIAFGHSALPAQGVDLVCIGGGQLTATELRAIGTNGLTGRVHQFDADDLALLRWYKHALLLAYPSLYEGFGIPPLEAMAAGCPVVAGRASSLPEVCGEAVEWADPGSMDSLVAALETVALSSSRAEDLRHRGYEQSARFSWSRCAEETAAVYHGLM